MNLSELFKWVDEHPEEKLYPCATIGGIVHLDVGNRRKIVTACGLTDTDFKHHRLIFCLPKQIITCPECLEDLELSSNPSFVSAMTRIVEGLDKSKIDLAKVKQCEFPPSKLK